jgi:hypothetical protein
MYFSEKTGFFDNSARRFRRRAKKSGEIQAGREPLAFCRRFGSMKRWPNRPAG